MFKSSSGAIPPMFHVLTKILYMKISKNNIRNVKRKKKIETKHPSTSDQRIFNCLTCICVCSCDDLKLFQNYDQCLQNSTKVDHN